MSNTWYKTDITKRIRFFLILFSLLVLFPVNIFTINQYNNRIERFSKTNELSNNNIKCITRDTTGFLWIGTTYGLNKFDGSVVRQYLFDPNDSTSVADNYIQKLYIDKQGSLWVLVPQYLCRYDAEKDNFVRYKYADKSKNTHTSNVGDIVEDEQGNLWIGTSEMGLYFFDKANDRISGKPFADDNINDICFEGKENLWIGGVGAIYIYNIKKEDYITVKLPVYQSVIKIDLARMEVFTSELFFDLKKDASNRYYLTARPFTPFSRNKGLVVLDMMVQGNNIWLGCKEKGLMIFNKETDNIDYLRFGKNNPHTISNNTVKALYKDKNGIIWIGTYDGLNKYNPYRNIFAHYLHEANKNSLVSDLVTAFNEDNNKNIWIGTFRGVSKLDPLTGMFTNYTNVPVNGKSMKIENIRDIAKDRKGDLWFSHKKGLFKLNTRNEKFSFIEFPSESQTGVDILCTFASDDSRLWVGTYGNGIFNVSCDDGIIRSRLTEKNSGLSSDFIKDIIQLKSGELCFATLRTGIDIYDPVKNTFRNIRFSKLANNYVADYINMVYQDTRNYLWVLSWYGAYVLNTDYEVIYSITAQNGIVTNELTAITEDPNHDIWLGTINGVSKISLMQDRSFLVSNYTVQDGLASNDICTGGAFTASDHTIYWGSSNGVNSFKINENPMNLMPTSPIITEFEIYNKKVGIDQVINGQIVLDKPIYMKESIRLNHKQNIISFYFSTLDFSQSGRVRYAHKLDGMDKDWVYSNDRSNSASYSNLYPGKYIFRVKSENPHGIWSVEKILEIRVDPPYWKTWWAYCIYVILFLLIFYSIMRVFLYQERLEQKLNIEKLEHEKENEINNIKLRFFTNMSHDIRTPLTLIIGPLGYILKHENLSDTLRKQLDVVKSNASYLLSLINQLLDFRKMETGRNSLQASCHDIISFIKEITHAFEPYASQRKLEVSFESVNDTEKIWFDPHLISKVMYNLISNAIKFTPQHGFVSVKIDSDDSHVFIRVEDTGIGIHPEEQSRIFDDFFQVHNTASSLLNSYTSGTGIGLSIAKKYVEIHQGSITVDSEEGKGSVFTVILKKGNEHFLENQIDNSNPELPEIDVPYFRPSGKNMAPAPAKKGEEEAAKERYSNSILVVDDNPDIVQFISNCLSGKFEIFSASDGVPGLEIAERELPDLIISDVMMPHMDGYEFCRQLKQNNLTSHIPVLFLTAKSSAEDAVKGLEQGAFDYIIKPFNETILYTKIENLIQDRNQLKERKEEKKEKQSASVRDINDPFLKKVIQYIDGKVDNADLSGEMIVQFFRINKMQLYRKLKAVCGMSVTDLIRVVRIEKACDLLINSDLNVSEIAYDLGFSDPFYFSKTFKKETGLSPLQYRKEKQGS